MDTKVRAYNTELFSKAYRSTGGGNTKSFRNNAPGGEGGVDLDVQFNLGAPGNQLDAIKDRKHGICCGISTAWIIGITHMREEAMSTSGFKPYFDNVLRFQGAYMKDVHETVSVDLDLLSQSYTHDTELASHNASCSVGNLAKGFPKSSCWGGYISAWGHAVAIGHANNKGKKRYFFMDPNLGLWKWKDKGSFVTEVQEYLRARRAAKGKSSHAKIKIWFYERG